MVRRQMRIPAYTLHPVEQRVFEPLGKQAGLAAPNLLEELVRAERIHAEASAALDRAARACRQTNGERWSTPPHTFEAIAEVLGISKQAAAKRYGRVGEVAE